MKLTEEQFDALSKWVYAAAELEARKVLCQLTLDDYGHEQLAASRAEDAATKLLVGEDK